MFESEHEPDMTDFSAMTIPELLSEQSHLCACGRSHDTELKYVRIESGAVRHLPEALNKLSVSRPFIVFDQNTYQAAGKKVKEELDQAGIKYSQFVFEPTPLKMEPDEYAVGALAVGFTLPCLRFRQVTAPDQEVAPPVADAGRIGSGKTGRKVQRRGEVSVLPRILQHREKNLLLV
ncbi:hypothetical protein SDC9_158759 [bioreactor metagenome]|uniref:Uncharacterized protein n=1 Tax=bioreactor metagenome TaxID=1076179 RepID=A0A645FAQ6_9ZZZZ